MNYENLNIDIGHSKILLVSFGGIKQGMGIPIYEFYNVFKDIGCDKVYIKDVNQAWYHKGVNREIDDIKKLKELLQKIIIKGAYEKVIFIGNSMGGYGAILFGALLNVDSVIAFSPQTFIGKINRFWYRDHRWKKELSKVYLDNFSQKKYYNLKKSLKREIFNPKIEIFYSLNDKLDSLHAERLKNQFNIKLVPYLKGNHNLIKVLRDDGELINIIRKSINS
ncbi:hypothetical protein HSX10_10540 [Winogradskyella undariae]|uniref:accessory Sec system protein Asp2 n=1 Tax=Winogradskyella undariae TaxID=1285465 RepID=UPI00156B6ECA|nr:accessory Sec system protein Asp2 [Winogradskyella undariae]NRR92003.1 hypothetical protein [Winogradskyella undariae]